MIERSPDRAIDHVVDALDVETYLICDTPAEGHLLALRLAQELRLEDVDVMQEEFDGFGMRVRIRATIHRPAGRYGWLKGGTP